MYGRCSAGEAGRSAAVAASSTLEEMTRHLEREIGVRREVITRAKVTIQ
jgi:hypothetical protein